MSRHGHTDFCEAEGFASPQQMIRPARPLAWSLILPGSYLSLCGSTLPYGALRSSQAGHIIAHLPELYDTKAILNTEGTTAEGPYGRYNGREKFRGVHIF